MKSQVEVNLPNEALVRQACLLFKEENGLVEAALGELFKHYPENTDASHVLLKASAVNALYYTNVYAIQTVALHIAHLGAEVDAAFASGLPSIVDLISRVEVQGKTHQFFSFASKYASWHKPNEYPIYDTRVCRYLSHVKAETNLFGFLNRCDWGYARFKEEMVAFREQFQLSRFTFKQLDAFLYMEGSKLFEAPAAQDAKLNPSADPAALSESPAAG
jgi:hypothetical protein